LLSFASDVSVFTEMKEITELPGWVVMWVVAGSLWVLFKSMVFVREGGRERVDPRFFLWVGTDVSAFRFDRAIMPARSIGLWSPLAFLLAGFPALMLAGGGENVLLTGWLGLVAMLCLMHFGGFDLLAAFWTRLGYPVERIMQAPWLAASLAEFWGQRWNRAFSDWARGHVFRPLVRKWGTGAGTFAGFLASGLAHELVISFPAGAGWGLPTLYFLFQGGGVMVQRKWKRLRRPTLTLAAVLLPAPLLFHPPFIREVFAPMITFLTSSN
jgi:alginate O-acetyltransferase complex protein AlgI